jgi:hypothetical protein
VVVFGQAVEQVERWVAAWCLLVVAGRQIDDKGHRAR